MAFNATFCLPLENLIVARPTAKVDIQKRRDNHERINALYEGRESVLHLFKCGILPLKSSQRKGIKILSSIKILQGLLTALLQLTPANVFKNFLNKSIKSYIPCIEQRKPLISYIIIQL